MLTTRRFVVLTLAFGLIAALAVPAFAAEEETTETTVVDEGAADPDVVDQDEMEATTDLQPAVTVPPPDTAEGPDDWTYRYLIPTLVALAAVVVVVTTVQYFMRVVRNRYKVVE